MTDNQNNTRTQDLLGQLRLILNTSDVLRENARRKMAEFFDALDPVQGELLHDILFEVIDRKDIKQQKLIVADLVSRFPAWRNACKTEHNISALMWAAADGSMDVFEILMDAGADITHLNMQGNGVLEFAASVREHHNIQEAVMKTVLEAHPFTHEQQSRALVAAVGARNLGAVRLLLRQGADFSQTYAAYKNDPAINSLQMVAHFGLEPFRKDVYEKSRLMEIVDLLLQSPHVVSVLNTGWGVQEYPRAPIHHAAGANNIETLIRLMKVGAWIEPPIDQIDIQNCMTPLMVAAERMRPEVIAFLLQHGANIHAVDRQGFTALHHICATSPYVTPPPDENLNFLAAAQQLLDAGADPQVKDLKGATPIQLAHTNRHKNLAQLLERCILRRSLQEAAGDGHAERQKKIM